MANSFYRINRPKSKILFPRKEKKVFITVVFFGLATVLVLTGVFFWGLSGLTKLSLFFGNLKNQPETNILTEKKNPPAPQLELPFTATNSAQVKIKGYSQPGTVVKVYLNEENAGEEILVDNDGVFQTSKLNLSSGENQIWAYAENSQGGKSQKSNILIVNFKDTPPKLELKSPEDKKEITGEKAEVLVSGETEAENEITINDRFVVVQPNGQFFYNFPLSSGENEIKTVATDQFGNQTIIEKTVTYSP